MGVRFTSHVEEQSRILPEGMQNKNIEHLQNGDLVFFKSKTTNNITHAGLIRLVKPENGRKIDEQKYCNGISIIHSTSSGNSIHNTGETDFNGVHITENSTFWPFRAFSHGFSLVNIVDQFVN